MTRGAPTRLVHHPEGPAILPLQPDLQPLVSGALCELGALWAPAPLPRRPIEAISRPFREKFPPRPLTLGGLLIISPQYLALIDNEC
jgi:hypothetical protein